MWPFCRARKGGGKGTWGRRGLRRQQRIRWGFKPESCSERALPAVRSESGAAEGRGEGIFPEQLGELRGEGFSPRFRPPALGGGAPQMSCFTGGRRHGREVTDLQRKGGSQTAAHSPALPGVWETPALPHPRPPHPSGARPGVQRGGWCHSGRGRARCSQGRAARLGPAGSSWRRGSRQAHSHQGSSEQRADGRGPDGGHPRPRAPRRKESPYSTKSARGPPSAQPLATALGGCRAGSVQLEGEMGTCFLYCAN